MPLDSRNDTGIGSGESPVIIDRARPWPLWQKALWFGVAYFACAEGSVLVNAKSSPNISFWLPCGLYVAVLLLNDYKTWQWLVPAAMVANFLFDHWLGTPTVLIFIFIAANTMQALVGAWLVRRFVARRPTMATLREYVGLIFFAGILSTFLGAVISATGQVVSGSAQSYARSFNNWWGSTAMATLLVSPLILVWSSELPKRAALFRSPKKLAEGVLLYAGLIAATWWIMEFGRGIKSPNKGPLLLFLLWAGLRFGIRGATVANLTLSLLSAFLIERYHTGMTPAEIASGSYVLVLQVGLAVATVLAVIPAIILGERDKTLEQLRNSEEKFSKAFRSSPTGIAITEMETGRHIDVNDSFSKLHGFTKEEMLGRTSVELGIFRSVAERDKVIAPVVTSGRMKDHIMRMRMPDGKDKTMICNAERIELDGKQCMVIVLLDITARLQAEERLEATSRQLRALASRVQSLREEERTHLAREIHDHLGQLLTALNLDLRLIERKAAGVADLELRAALQGKLASARALADETITSVQKIASELRPATLDRLGLEAAIEVEAQAFQSRTGVECQWSLPANPVAANPEQATAIFRIFQEILTNVARHAHARNLAVRLSQANEDLLLEVEDDGVGIQPEQIASPSSLGLLGMQERAAILGGRIDFSRNSQTGTAVVVRVPLNGKAGGLS